MSINLQVLKQLSDGRFHSGESLGKLLGVSRTAVWKAMQSMQSDYEVQVQSVKGRGYRLSQPVELLDEQAIMAKLGSGTRQSLKKFDILSRVDSTNRYLLAAASQGEAGGQLVLAEQQMAGRGRLGRSWVSPFGYNIYCSLLWRFNLASSELSGLGIVVAVALINALSHYCAALEIKWPNDILCNGRKLAGILLEMQGEANGPATVVMGLGINVNMPATASAQIDQAWTDLQKASGKQISRNELAARIIEQLVQSVKMFEKEGLGPFVSSWSQWDVLRDQPVDIVMATQTISGIARGIDKLGALRVETAGGIKSFMAGEASLRKRI